MAELPLFHAKHGLQFKAIELTHQETQDDLAKQHHPL